MNAETNTQSLLQLNARIKGVLTDNLSGLHWVVAEISDMNINRSGHCYIELIEKDNNSGNIVAKARATIWAFAFRMIKPYFETTTGESLRTGIKVLLNVSVEYHEIYGFSLNIHDIDPQYTIGDLARKKQEIRQRLINEGVFEMNKQTYLTRVPQRIAVISSETAAGYGDFVNQLQNNTHGFDLDITLFSAIMQGEKTGVSIIQAMNAIFDQIDNFDVIVIIRGGGAKSELSSFDNYDLAFFITQSPIPVLTGMGHERDDTLADEVAHTRLKTPTAVAEFLIDALLEFSEYLHVLQTNISVSVIDMFDEREHELSKFTERLNRGVRDIMEQQSLFMLESKQKLHLFVNEYLAKNDKKLSRSTDKLSYSVNSFLAQHNNMLNKLRTRLQPKVEHLFVMKDQKLTLWAKEIKLIDPQNVLDRGYAYVTQVGKGIISSNNQVTAGDRINIRLAKGSINADVV